MLTFSYLTSPQGWMLVVLLGGVMTGSFGLPAKYTTKWKWENTWAVFSLWALLIIPWVAALLSIPNLFAVLAQSGLSAVVKVFVFGCLWGVSSIAFGFGMHYLGLALGYSLMMGMIIAVGALVPLITSQPGEVSAAGVSAIIGGVAVILLGVALSAWAAVHRQRDQAVEAPSAGKTEAKSILLGLIVCIVAGVTAPMLNFAFAYGDTIRTAAEKLGTSKTLAPNAVWVVTLLGGFTVNLTYTLTVIHKNGNWRLFVQRGTGMYYFYALLMGLLWAGSIIVYGMATANLGKLGPSIGWAAFNGIAIFWANCLGLLAGEWKGVGRKGMWIMTAGLLVLLAGILIASLERTL